MTDYELTIRKRGLFILKIIEEFKDYRNENGEKFSNTLLRSLFMGKLSQAWTQEIIEDKAVSDKLTAALDQNKKLLDLNAQLTANQGSSPITTPAGVTLDADDLATVDAIVAKHSTTPVPNVP